LQDCAVIRLTQGRLAWYAPGGGDTLRYLDEDGAKEQLSAAVAQPGTQLVFAAPGGDVRLQTIEINPDEKKHIEKSLPYMLEEELISDVDEMHFASSFQGKSTLRVAACLRSKMNYWQGLLGDFQTISQWLPEPLLLPWRPGEWVLVIESGTAIVRLGEFEGFTVELDLLPVMLESAMGEHSDQPDTIVVYGQRQEEDVARVPEALRSAVQWRKGGLGAALLLRDETHNPLNLLQGNFAVRLPFTRWWKQWRAVAAVISLAFCLQLVATYSEFVSLQRENTQLSAAVEQSYRKANPRGAMVDAEKQLSRQLSALQGSAQAGGFVSLMSRLGEVIHANPGTSIASINYSDKADEVRMNISANNFESVETIRTAMNQAGLSAKMESSSAQGDKVRARMRIGADL
jgi:general secretion pathway protein L